MGFCSAVSGMSLKRNRKPMDFQRKMRRKERMPDPGPAETCHKLERRHALPHSAACSCQMLQRPLLNSRVHASRDSAGSWPAWPRDQASSPWRTCGLTAPLPPPKKNNHMTARIHFDGDRNVFPTLAESLSAIRAVFKVSGNSTKDSGIMRVWVQHLQTGLGIFGRLLIWKNQTCETDSLCSPPPLFLSVFWSAPLLITWQGHRRRLSGFIHRLPAAGFCFFWGGGSF